jgi:hypothetical protein
VFNSALRDIDPSALRAGQFAFPRDPLVLLLLALDAVFGLTIAWKHFDDREDNRWARRAAVAMPRKVMNSRRLIR